MMEEISVNLSSVQKIEAFLSNDSYKEMLDSSESFNSKQNFERKMRLPFLDPITAIAQNHSTLFMKKRQRLPGLRPGQCYSYPQVRWRKSRRQYLTNPRPYGKVRKIEEIEEHLENSSSLGAADTDSKDSNREMDVPREWFYDEIEMHEIDNFDEEPDSDGDYEEPYSLKRQRRRGGRGSSRNSGGAYVPSRPRGRGSRGSRAGSRGGRSNQSPTANVESPSSVDSPCTSQRPGPRSQRNNLPQLMPHTSTQLPPAPPVPTSGSAASSFLPTTFDVEPQMPVLLPEQKPPEDPDDKLLPPAHYIRKPQEKGKATPSPYCDFCLGDSKENKKTSQPEDLVSCSDCGRSGHPTCLQFTKNMIISVKKYRWQCIECKYCTICGTSDNDDQLLFCDDCDRGYHMYCLAPPLYNPPEGSWSCKLCNLEFHSHK